MQLKAVRFGQNQHLIGFYRASPLLNPKGRVVLFWNTGLWNRSGPHRLNTELAMQLADLGYASFCFDLSALGDSEYRRDSTGLERTLADLSDACAFLSENFGHQEFILFGVCSSAIDAHHFARLEKRVVGLVMIDTYAYRIKQFYLHYYAQRFISPQRWKNFITKSRDKGEDSEAQSDLFEGVYPEQVQAGLDLQALVDRGVSLWVAFTGGFRHIYSYQDQFVDSFPEVNFRGKLTLRYFKKADHLFSIRSQRAELFQELITWFQQNQTEALTEHGSPPLPTMTQLIQQWEKEQDPLAIAIEHRGEAISYREFQRAVDNLIAHMEAQGIKPGDRVGIALPRSPDLIFALIATVKMGACYVPIDLGYPAERIHTIISVAQPGIVLCYQHQSLAFQPTRTLHLDTLSLKAEGGRKQAAIRGPHDPVYIIFTSGSTGTPKGVVMGQAALAQLIEWQNQTYRRVQKTLQFSPISFDVSFQELFATFSTGGTLVLISEEERLDPRLLLRRIYEQRVERLFLPYVALQLLAEAAEREQLYPSSLVEVFTAGEQLICTSEIRQLFSKIAGSRLHNQYGPSETHVATAYSLPESVAAWPDLPSIGSAIKGSACFILNETGELIEDEGIGELILAGVCVGEGYWADEDRTRERFIELEVAGKSWRAYRTGDLARWLPDKQIAFLGRRDDQVKVRGFRIELGEVEAAIKDHPSVAQAVVIAHGDVIKTLIALVQLKDDKADWSDLSQRLELKLPDYMRPQRYLLVSDIPRTPSGKIDRRELARHITDRAALSTVQPASRVASHPGKILAAFEAILGRSDLGADPHFFEAGGSSILAIKLAYKLEEVLQKPVSVLQIFENPRASQLQAFLEEGDRAPSGPTPTASDSIPGDSEPIAIIGMAARMPGAPDLAAYWKMLLEGREGISQFSADELDPTLDSKERQSPAYVPRRGILDQAECFDADYFKIMKAEAESIDPQQRVFLEAAFHALEDGHYLERKGERIGVFAGSAHNTYYIRNVLRTKAAQTTQGAFAAMLANDKDYLATRVAFKLGLTGPAMDIQTACSSSAVALIQAVMSLRSGQCEAALAGGVAITVPMKSGYLANDGGMLSPSGHCRPFASNADGTLFSDGVGVVLLKPLSAAQRDGDRIYSIIRGIGINNDGAEKASFTAPSIQGQRAAIEAAWKNAGLALETAVFMECHGTATALGDPMELEALRGVFAKQARSSIMIGSVKGNIGHTTAAAGVAGLIKASLCLYHRHLVPSIHVQQPNPLLNIEESPFQIATKPVNLPKDKPQLSAGVSSFGVGGTNAHIVLSCADQVASVLHPPLTHELIFLAAPDASGLKRLQTQTAEWAKNILPEEQRALAKSYLSTKSGMAKAYGLLGPNRDISWKQQVSSQVAALIWTFPGQGTQTARMGQQLLQNSKLFRSHWQRLSAYIAAAAGWKLDEILADQSPEAKLQQTEFAQPAIFCCSLALAYTLRDLQLAPDLCIGHSIGELAACTYAGLWSDEAACAIIVKRGQLMGALPPGAMTAVVLSADKLRSLLHPDLDIAAINSDAACVISGDRQLIEEQEKVFTAKAIRFVRLRTSHAFHSRAMNPIVQSLQEFVASFSTRKLQHNIVSTQTGQLLTQQEASDPQFWAEQLRNPVLFHAGMQACQSLGKPILALEIGSGTVTSALARKALPELEVRAVPILDRPDTEWSSYLQAIGELWLNGLTFDRTAALDLQQQKPLWRPGYPFAKNRYFIEPESNNRKASSGSAEPIQERFVLMQEQQQQRWNFICREVVAALEECSGMEGLADHLQTSFFDLGLDSLFLTQASLTVGERLGLSISFRQMSEDLTSVQAIVDYAARELPAERFAPAPAPAHAPAPSPTMPTAAAPVQVSVPALHVIPTPAVGSQAEQLFQQQLDIMRMQIQALTGQTAAPLTPLQTQAAPERVDTLVPAHDADTPPPKQAFGAIARISTDRLSGNETQNDCVRRFTQAYNRKTSKSKEYAGRYRKMMADPRVVTGFRPAFKELVYPIVTNRSSGPYIWDIDGNRYIDLLNGFGSNFFGHAPDFIKEILLKQIDAGYEIGPQFHMVGEASEMAAAMTGHDRVAWCNTGSEAVLGCIRIARTVTGKKKIVSFQGSYHGINDEVIVRSNAKRKAFPAAPGIMPNSVENMLVLDYGTEESLAIIEKEIGQLAAVLVEPVQSRRPEFVPLEFWRRLRQITEKHGVPLIFDEVITGFRYHPGGVQQAFGVQADLSSYGKVVGGGLPIGMIAGKKRFMDALDGGFWNFGDESIPEVGVTYFAGTFVRHPLAIAAAYATLKEIQITGGRLQNETNARSDELCKELNAIFDQLQVPYHYCNFGSLMKLKVTDDKNPFAELLPCWLRSKGLHVWDFPSFLTSAHKDEHVRAIIQNFQEALQEMVNGGLFGRNENRSLSNVIKQDFPAQNKGWQAANPPQAGARLGKTKSGQPAWFIEDPERPGRYLQIAVVK